MISCWKEFPKTNMRKFNITSTLATLVMWDSKNGQKKDKIAPTPQLSHERSKSSSTSFDSRCKRRKLVEEYTSKVSAEKLCIIWNQMKSKGGTKRLRICEATSLSICPTKFNKDTVYSRFSLLEKFGGCICSRQVVLQQLLIELFEKIWTYVEVTMNLPMSTLRNSKFHNLDLVKTINLRSHAYTLSDCGQFLNEILC